MPVYVSSHVALILMLSCKEIANQQRCTLCFRLRPVSPSPTWGRCYFLATPEARDTAWGRRTFLGPSRGCLRFMRDVIVPIRLYFVISYAARLSSLVSLIIHYLTIALYLVFVERIYDVLLHNLQRRGDTVYLAHLPCGFRPGKRDDHRIQGGSDQMRVESVNGGNVHMHLGALEPASGQSPCLPSGDPHSIQHCHTSERVALSRITS